MRYEFVVNGIDKLVLYPLTAKEEMLMADVFAGEVEVVKDPGGKQYILSPKKKTETS